MGQRPSGSSEEGRGGAAPSSSWDVCDERAGGVSWNGPWGGPVTRDQKGALHCYGVKEVGGFLTTE